MSRRSDIISGLVLAIVGVVLVFGVIPANTSPPQSENNLSPAFLPTVAAGVMLVLSALLAVMSWFGRGRTPDQLHEEFGEEARGLGWRELADIAIWSAFAGAMMAGFMTVGFLATAIPALVLMMLYSGQRNLIAVAAVAVAVPVVIQQIAWHAFTVQLP